MGRGRLGKLRLSIWGLEWRLAFRRRRLLILNMGIPLLLVVPICIGGAPAYHASAAFAVLFVLFGTFGSAIPLLREGDGGPLRRIILRGVSEPTLVAERVLASAGLDTLELLPALLVILSLRGAEATVWALLIPSVLVALVAANLVGVWVAAGARSMAEGALFAAVVSLFLLHGSGVFRTPEPGGWGVAIEGVLPFAPLHEVLFSAAGGAGPAVGLRDLLVPAGATLLLFSLTLFASRTLMERITFPEG